MSQVFWSRRGRCRAVSSRRYGRTCCGPRVGGVHLLGLAAVVVGQHQLDLAGLRIGLDVLGPVHLRGAQRVAGEPGLDQHLGLIREAFSAVSGP